MGYITTLRVSVLLDSGSLFIGAVISSSVCEVCDSSLKCFHILLDSLDTENNMVVEKG